MAQLSYRRHCLPVGIIQHAIWHYLRFTLSYRDVEELLAERGLDVSYETVRRWCCKRCASAGRKMSSRAFAAFFAAAVWRELPRKRPRVTLSVNPQRSSMDAPEVRSAVDS